MFQQLLASDGRTSSDKDGKDMLQDKLVQEMSISAP